MTQDYKADRRITLRLQKKTVGITVRLQNITVGITAGLQKIAVGITLRLRWDYREITGITVGVPKICCLDYVKFTLGLH